MKASVLGRARWTPLDGVPLPTTSGSRAKRMLEHVLAELEFDELVVVARGERLIAGAIAVWAARQSVAMGLFVALERARAGCSTAIAWVHDELSDERVTALVLAPARPEATWLEGPFRRALEGTPGGQPRMMGGADRLWSALDRGGVVALDDAMASDGWWVEVSTGR